MRKVIINNLKPWTNIGIKGIERAGDRIEDQPRKSNPWEGIDCGREGWVPCDREKIQYKDCT